MQIVTACVHDRDTDTVDTVKALHDLQELFASLRAAGIKIAVCTADNRTPTMNTLKVRVHSSQMCVQCVRSN